MSNKNLGRGLSAFLDLDGQMTDQENNNRSAVINIGIDNIVANPFQPRKKFEEENLKSLSESIKRKGVLQPILVVKSNNGKYQLVAGERRFRATKLAGLTEIPAIVTEIGEKDQLEIAILENIQREDLNPIEEAEAYKRLMEEFSHTQEELSEILGKSRSHIANILRLLTLPEDVKELLREKKLTFGHARTLIGSENASALAKHIVDSSMNVRETEDLLKSIKNSHYQMTNESKDKNRYTDPEVSNIAHQISSMIGLQVNIKLKNKGGIVEIGFKDFGELDRLLGKLNG